jgi:RecG-like helicase
VSTKKKNLKCKSITTKYVPYYKREDCFKWVNKKIKESNFKAAAFIVYPLIEESYSLMQGSINRVPKFKKYIL